MSNIKHCGYCGNTVDAADRHCRTCGKDLTVPVGEPPQVYYKPIPQTARICCNCGKTLPAAVQFCGECGAKNEIVKDKKLPYCVLCNELLPESARYCTLCGMQYVEKEDGFVEIPVQPTCGTCGTVFMPGTTFCTKCGAPAERKQAARIKKTVPACRECGTPIRVDRNFCDNCGRQVTNCRAALKNVTVKQQSGAYVRPIVLGNGRLQCPVCGLSDMHASRTSCWNCSTKFIKPE